MTGPRLEGKVALVTGAARGQGRSHAIRLAEEGADVIGVDICRDLDGLDYPLASTADLAETANMVEETGRRMITSRRRRARPRRRCAGPSTRASRQLGHLDVVVANAGVCAVRRGRRSIPTSGTLIIGVNLTGAWNTCSATLPHLVDGGGGSLILVSSAAGLKGQPFFAPYPAAKHGLVGLMRSLANELATCWRAGQLGASRPAWTRRCSPACPVSAHVSPRARSSAPCSATLCLSRSIDPADVSHAVLYLASDESRAVTGHTLAVDAGISAR